MKLLRSYRFWLGILFLLVLVLIRFTGIGDYFHLAGLQAKQEHLQLFVDAHYLSAVFIFMLVYILEVVLVLPFAALLTLIGGFLFGVIPGTFFSALGATIGATVFFLIIRSSLGAVIQKRYRERLKGFNENLKQYGTSYLIAVRMLVFLPFFIQNIAIGLTKVSLVTYMITTFIGVLPASLVYAYAGQQLATIHSIKDVFSVPIVFAFILMMLLGFVPIMVQRKLNENALIDE